MLRQRQRQIVHRSCSCYLVAQSTSRQSTEDTVAMELDTIKPTTLVLNFNG
jgi:hypothetical protein